MKSIFIICLCLMSTVWISGCVENPDDTYDYFVDDDFTPSTPGWDVTKFVSISHALNMSKDHDAIFVYAGIYYETFSINKSVTLKGEHAPTTIIDGNHTKSDILLIEGNGWVDISGFTFRNSGSFQQYGNISRYAYDEAAIDVRSNGNRIWENIFINNSCGIYGVYAKDNQIKRNKFDGNIEYGAYLLTNSDENFLSENVFLNNTCALRIKGSTNSTVTSNVFMHNHQGLFLCCGSKFNLVYRNTFYNNSEWNAHDLSANYWDNGSIIIFDESGYETTLREENMNKSYVGNFWDTFYLEAQGAYDNNTDGIADSPYYIPDVQNDDHFPLMKPPMISNPFFTTDEIDV